MTNSSQDKNLEQVAESQEKARLVAWVGVAFSMAALFLVVLAIGFLVAGLRKTVDDLSYELKQDSVNAILASSNITDNTAVSVPVLFYSQKADECVDLYDAALKKDLISRQFEWTKCGYYNGEVETELVEGLLDDEYLPVATGTGRLTPNRGINTESFERWFKADEVSSYYYPGSLILTYNAESASFEYGNEKFYPLSEIEAAKNESLFTMNMGVPIQVLGNGEEEFEITADDDTFVFVGDKMVLDMGGVHDAVTGKFEITKNGEVYAAVGVEEYAYAGVTLEVGEGAIVRIFHANRDSESSVFRLKFSKMVLNVLGTTIARGDKMEVAYDPAEPEPGYVAPLGETLTVRADRTKTLFFALTIQMLMMGMLAVVAVVVLTRIILPER